MPNELGIITGAGYGDALAGILALGGYDISPTMNDEERTVYRAVGAGLVLRIYHMLRQSLAQQAEVAGALRGFAK